MRCKEVAMTVPDHSLLQWDTVRGGVGEVRMEEEPPEMRKKYVLPEDFLEREVESIRGLVSKLRGAAREQEVLDELYIEVVVLLKRDLVDKRGKRR